MLNLNVRVTDSGGLSYIKALTVDVHNLHEGPERVSVSSTGEQANGSSYYPSISADGHYVTYSSYASNLVPGDTNGARDIFVYDRDTNTTERVSVSSTGEQGNSDSLEPSISADGRYVTYNSYASNLVQGDTNDARDIFVYDRDTNTTERVSVSSTSEQGNSDSVGILDLNRRALRDLHQLCLEPGSRGH